MKRVLLIETFNGYTENIDIFKNRIKNIIEIEIHTIKYL